MDRQGTNGSRTLEVVKINRTRRLSSFRTRRRSSTVSRVVGQNSNAKSGESCDNLDSLKL